MIRLTNKHGNPILLNRRHIVSVYHSDSDRGTVVNTADEWQHVVIETLEEVAAALDAK